MSTLQHKLDRYSPVSLHQDPLFLDCDGEETIWPVLAASFKSPSDAEYFVKLHGYDPSQFHCDLTIGEVMKKYPDHQSNKESAQ